MLFTFKTKADFHRPNANDLSSTKTMQKTMFLRLQDDVLGTISMMSAPRIDGNNWKEVQKHCVQHVFEQKNHSVCSYFQWTSFTLSFAVVGVLDDVNHGVYHTFSYPFFFLFFFYTGLTALDRVSHLNSLTPKTRH